MKKKKETTDKIMRICPHCKKKLKDVGIGVSQGGNMLYKVWFDKNDGDLQYETDEFRNEDRGEFYCRNCGKSLYFNGGDEEIKKILK